MNEDLHIVLVRQIFSLIYELILNFLIIILCKYLFKESIDID